jgi:hypothetical protein
MLISFFVVARLFAIIMIATLGIIDSAPISNSPKTACVAF